MGYKLSMTLNCDKPDCTTVETVTLNRSLDTTQSVKYSLALAIEVAGWGISMNTQDGSALLLCPDCLKKLIAQEKRLAARTSAKPDARFLVISWDSGIVLKEFNSLPLAKRYARQMGWDPIRQSGMKGFAPYAYVGNDKKEVIYNPRFAYTKED